MIALLDSQTNAIAKLQKYKVGALFMDTGTGKTRTMLELVNSVSGVDLVLYVAPYSAIHPPVGVSSIIDEVNKWGGFNAPVEFIGVESIGQSDRIYLNILSLLSSSSNPFLVVDESIKIKNFSAKRTKRLLNLSEIAEYKLIANATPITRNILDVWAQMEFLSPKILKMHLAQFENTFCEKTKLTKIVGNKHLQKEFVSGYANIDYLYSLIGHFVYECDLDIDVEESYSDISFKVDNTDEYYRLKEKYLDDETLLWKSNNIFLEMTQKMQHSYCLSEHKIEQVRGELNTLDVKRTAIYCKYIDSQHLCKDLFPKSLILSYQKNALSLNLQDDYDNLVFWDKIWDYYLVKQAKGRIKRGERKEQIRYIATTGNVGLEKMIDDNIAKKIGMVEYIRKVSIEQLRESL